MELARLREKPLAQIAKGLGIAESGLCCWMVQADVDAGKREGLTCDERRELVELRRQQRVLEMEVEIFKCARVNSPVSATPVGVLVKPCVQRDPGAVDHATNPEQSADCCERLDRRRVAQPLPPVG